MAVIINEFEVVIEPPASPPPQPGTADGAPPEPKQRVLSPYELAVLLDHQAKRIMRLMAH